MARFVPNPAFRQELEAAAEFQTGMAVITGEVAASIKTAAEPFRRTGYFIRKIDARRNLVLLRDPFAHLVEFGSVNNVPQGNARRGVLALGLRFRDDGPKQAD